MRRILITLLCAGITLTTSTQYSNNDPITIAPSTQSIYHTLYLIFRLRESVDTLLYNKSCTAQVQYSHIKIPEDINPYLKTCLRTIKEKKKCSSLRKAWDYLSSYRFSQNYDFGNNFVRAVHAICQTLNHTEQSSTTPTTILGLLNEIDYLIEPFIYKKSITRRLIENEQEQKTVSIDNILHNFYLTRRLARAEQVLDSVRTITVFSKNTPSDIQFNHERIKECMAELYQEGTTKPLKRVFKDLRQYRYADDDLFLKEMLMAVFVVYKNLLFANLSNESEKIVMSEMDTILSVYENIESTPLEDILDVIDATTNKFEFVKGSHDREAQTTFDKIKSWVLPACATTITVYALYTLYNHTRGA